MKKKFFGTLMLGAIAIASLSLTSCKDYDDDINANTQRIEDLESSIESLQSSLTTCKTECETKIEEVTTAYTAAIAAAQSELQAAIDAKADTSTVNDISDKLDQLQEDYDASIAALTADLEDINTSITNLQTAVDKKLDKTDFETFKTTYDEAVAAYQLWQGTVNDKLSELEDADEKIYADFSDSLSARDLAIQDLQRQIDALNEWKETTTGEKLSERIDSVINVINTTREDLLDSLSNTNLRIDTLSKYLNENYVTITKLNSEIATLTILINKQLTSLVLKPAFYYGGIEAVEYPILRNYASYTVEDDLTINEIWSTANGTKVNISEGGAATYHVNPDMADLEGYSIDFYGNDPITYGNDPITRSGIQFVTPTYTKFDELYAANATYYNKTQGLLTIPFQVNISQYEKTVNEGKTPMIALQMTKKLDDGTTRTVTSDYAMIHVSDYDTLIIADNTFDTHIYQTTSDLNEGHVFGQVDGQKVADLAPETVIPNHEISKDSAFDLKKIIETHYSYKDNNSDALLDSATFAAMGLSYQFDTISYRLTGRNKTEASYITLNNGVVSANGNIAAQGHMPIIRVLLKDKNGNVLKVGYIKIKIAGSTEPLAPENYGDEKDTVDCEGIAFSNLLYSKIEQDLYTKPEIDMTQAQFKTTYILQYTGDSICTQYTLNKDGKYVEDSTALGTVTVEDGKVIWSFTKAETDSIRFDANGKNIDALTTYIKFSNGGNLNAYASITIPAGAITKTILSLNDDNKVLARWYKENTMNQNLAASELNEIHVTPEVVGQTGSDDEIKFSLLEAFKDQQPTFVDQSGKDVTVDDFKFIFVKKPGNGDWIVGGVSGSTYKLTVSEDGTKLLATTNTLAEGHDSIFNEEIATLSGDHNGLITFNTKAANQDLASYDILNKNGHNELGENETFKAYIGVQAEVCDDYETVKTITARFLRPVDLKTTNAEAGTDAVDAGFDIDLTDLFDTPADWRDQWVENDTDPTLDYWTYYGITNIEADLDNAYTDAAQPADKRVALSTGFDDKAAIESLAKITSANIHITYQDATSTSTQYGVLHYDANGATITDFHVYVPITVTYDWGYKVSMGYARIDVGQTVNNAK